MISHISDYFANNYADVSKYTKVCGGLCGIAAAEMAIRTISDLNNIVTGRDGDTEKHNYNLSPNLGGAIFYGLCAANVLPHTALIGSAIFTIYSAAKYWSCREAERSEHMYVSSILIAAPVDALITKIAWPILRDIAWPIVRTAGEIMGSILKSIPIPNHPIWALVGLLGVAIILGKVVYPRFR